MAKIRNLSDIQQQIAFTEFDFYQLYVATFKSSELGRIKSLLPLREMAISFGLIEGKNKSLRVKRGRKPFFSPEGKVALVFLKMYTGLSAPKLMEALNGNIHYQIFCGISSHLGEHRMRTKYNDIEKAHLAYRKQRKHTHKQTRKMIMRLLGLLGKMLGEIRRQMRVHPDEEILSDRHLYMLDTITKVYRQQKKHFKSGDSRESIPNRIVSVSKPYVRPIVRGKETKSVEFGAKCNNILIDGISFIEKLSFNAFNEGTRLKHCVSLAQKLTGEPVKKIGGDQGYSGNDNRTFCKENKIETSFTRKGRPGKNEVKSATKRELARMRATAMEGSFGTQKEHYGLRKIAARIKSTEIMLIFFGIHTANVVNLARRESVQAALAA